MHPHSFQHKTHTCTYSFIIAPPIQHMHSHINNITLVPCFPLCSHPSHAFPPWSCFPISLFIHFAFIQFHPTCTLYSSSLQPWHIYTNKTTPMPWPTHIPISFPTSHMHFHLPTSSFHHIFPFISTCNSSSLQPQTP